MHYCETSYLSEVQLSGFENYKYSCVDSSPLSNYVMHPFWNSVVKLCPRGVAPNVLTLTGFFLTVINYLLLTYYDPEFDAASLQPSTVPSWLWMFIAVSLFVAHTLDGIDGKHARRLGMSGPLGELFDHGLDSWSSYFIPITVYSVFGRGEFSVSPWRMLALMWTVWLSFLLSHWEKYITGVLYLPWSYDMSQLGVLLLYLVTFVFGHNVWKFCVFSDASVSTEHIGSNCLSPAMITEAALWLGFLLGAVPVTVYNIYKSRVEGGCAHKREWRDFIAPLLSPTFLVIVTSMWAAFSPSDIVNTNLRLFSLMISVVFSNICCRLIVAQMSSTRVEYINRLLVLVCGVAGVCTCVLPRALMTTDTAELAILCALTAVVCVAHVHYGVCVVRQMCRHFNIAALSVRKRASD